MKKIKISIRRSSFFILMASATFTVFCIAALWTYTEINRTNSEIEKIQDSYLYEQQYFIKDEVLNIVSLIDFARQIEDGRLTLQLQNEILDYLSSIRLNYGGYVFINQYDGRALVYDGVKIIGDKNIKNLTDPDGLRIFDAELAATHNPDGDYLIYKFKRLSTTEPVPKMSYVKGYDDWKWIIGAGIYLDDLSLVIEQERNQQEVILYKKVLYILLIFSFVLIILSVFASYLSRFIKKEFNVFMSFLSTANVINSVIDIDKLHVEEFKQIAQQANNVVRKQRSTEELLKIERDKARQYLDIADVIILALDTEGLVTLINKKGWETLGYNLEYIIGKNWISYFIPLLEKQLLFERYSFLMSGKSESIHEDTESKIITKSGEERIIAWSNTIIYKDDGTPSGILSSGNDITKRRMAEKSFSESEEKYKLLFEKSTDPVLIIGVNNTFIDCNNAALDILGLQSRDELIGRHPDSISPEKQPDGSFSIIKASEMIAIAKRKGHNRFEWLHYDKYNKDFHVDVSLTVIPIKGIEYLYVIWHDISERKQQFNELIVAKEKAETNEDIKTSFLHNMQHEIRTPLNVIMGFSHLLKQGGLDVEVANTFHDDIIKSGNQLSKIIDEIIDFSMLQSGYILINNRNTELRQLLSEVYKNNMDTLHDKSVDFNIKICSSGNNTVIRTDVDRLKQVITHLLDNAFKFTDEGEIELGYSIEKNVIRFYVSDTGVGIEEKNLDSIFDKFNRITYKNPAKLYGGTGLGLSISKVIINNLDGYIEVESKLNMGSTFTFTLPYKPIEIEDDIQNATFENRNITVVTSNKAKLKLIVQVLKNTTANIIHIKNGVKAVEFCQENYSTDLMIIDSNLDGMGCITTVKAIKAFNKELPIAVLFLSNNEKLSKEEVLIAGSDDYLFMSQVEKEIKLNLALLLDPGMLDDKEDIQ